MIEIKTKYDEESDKGKYKTWRITQIDRQLEYIREHTVNGIAYLNGERPPRGVR